ncbi:zinc finger protein 354C-like isoform X1 [Conger conger]|uniref:zinc finger protein 354C-like isoform X1 n=1 Tax=Conger conger TaxID=82655 RepID=UPI002A59A305|nr:zinc finger protein 354C-like isoform X1 [Conger conger]
MQIDLKTGSVRLRGKKMTNVLDIQAELASIMDILAKSAVAEISRLVDDGAALLRLEISRSHREIAVLRRTLQLKESELQVSRRLQGRFLHSRSVAGPGCRALGTEREKVWSPAAERVFGQEWSFTLSRDGEPAGVEEMDTPLLSSLSQNQSANIDKVRTEPVLIKQEGLGEDLCYSDPQSTPVEEEQVTQPTPAGDGKKPDTEPTPAGGPEELSEQHRCGHGDEELSGLEFVVKAEQEEEHVAQRLNQTGCEHSAGRLNNLGSEYVTYERNSQLWTSFTREDSDVDDPICSNATEHCSHNLSIHTQLQHAPATAEVSGDTLSPFGASHVEEFDQMGEKPSACSEELRSEAIRTQQGQYGETPGSLTKGDAIARRQPLQYGESNPDISDGDRCAPLRARAETRAKGHRRAGMGEKRFSCAQCGKSFTTRFYLKIHRRIHTGERPFKCTQCGKGFYCTSHLTSHQRSHTGEKPYSCDECGNSYSHLNSLKLHYRVHAEEKELNCA